MPPKRKRADADSAATGSTARSTKKSSKATWGKNGVADVTEGTGMSNSMEPTSKKAKATSKKSGSASNQARGTRMGPRVFGVDDGPISSSTSQQQSDNEVDMPKEAPPIVPTKIEYTPQRAQALFKAFADEDDPDVIGPGGVERLCTEASISLESAQPLVLAWQFKAKEMAKLSRSEWLQGTEALRISSLPVLAMALKELDDLVIHNKEPITPASLLSIKKRDGVDLQEPYNRSRYRQYALNPCAAFTELYQFCFALFKPQQSRNLDIETAMAVWSVLLATRYPIITELIEFLGENKSYKGANRDIWNMVYEFCRTINAELDNYEADGAWPTLLDDFVVWKKGRMAHSTSDKLATMDEQR